MHRLFLFLCGATIVSLALPFVLGHHARAEIMQLAWCSASGSARATPGLFGVHCPACPALMGGIALMIASPFLGGIRRLAEVKKGR